MTFWLTTIGIAIIAYFLGSVPTGYLAGRLFGDIDIREHGSKSTGATNVLRTLGKWPALAVLVVDILKGAAAVAFAQWLCHWFDLQSLSSWVIFVAGLAALLGHGRSIWLNFTGGKSAATGLGVLLAMSPMVGLGAALIWASSLATFRIVSLSSLLAALTAIGLVLISEQPLAYRLLVIAGGIYVIVRHGANIQRLLAGTEPKLGQKHS